MTSKLQLFTKEVFLKYLISHINEDVVYKREDDWAKLEVDLMDHRRAWEYHK